MQNIWYGNIPLKDNWHSNSGEKGKNWINFVLTNDLKLISEKKINTFQNSVVFNISFYLSTVKKIF